MSMLGSHRAQSIDGFSDGAICSRWPEWSGSAHSPAPESVVDGRVECADDEQREEEVEGARDEVVVRGVRQVHVHLFQRINELMYSCFNELMFLNAIRDRDR